MRLAILALSIVTSLALTVACSSAEPSEQGTLDSTQSVEQELIISCTSNAQCGPSAYCNLKQCTAPGACAPKPGACPTVVAPVCGCDNKTYSNSCFAASAGVSVKHTGSCIRTQ